MTKYLRCNNVLDLILLVVFINLIMIIGMFLFSRFSNIRISTLFISLSISIMLCLLYPILAAWITFKQIIFLYLGFILAGTGLLYLAENKIYHDSKNRTEKTFKEILLSETLDDQQETKVVVELELKEVSEINEVLLINAVSEMNEVSDTAKVSQTIEVLEVTEKINTVSEVAAVLDVEAMGVKNGLFCVEEQIALENQNQDISSLVSGGFDCLAMGNSVGAINNFFKALRQNPPPQLAVMLVIKISSLYLDVGCKTQALSVIDTFQDVWGPLLDEKDLKRIEKIKIQLRREI